MVERVRIKPDKPAKAPQRVRMPSDDLANESEAERKARITARIVPGRDRINAERKANGNHGVKRGRGRRLTFEKLRKMDEEFPGEFPHEFLLRVMRTGKVNITDKKRLSPELRIKCAAHAAPYYAPRMSAIAFKPDALPYDLGRLAGVPPEHIEIANKVLSAIFGAEYSPDAPALLPAQGRVTDATLYEESLQAGDEGEGEEDGDEE